MYRNQLRAGATLAVMGGVLLVACTDQSALNDPAVAFDHISGDLSHAVLCKVGSGASFDITNGDVASTSLNDGDCEQVATHDASSTPLTVTVTETAADLGFMLDQVQIDDYRGFIDPAQLVSSTTVSGPGATADLVDDHVLVFTFTNVPIPSADGRMTGGGNPRIRGISLSEGLTLHCDITLSNNLNINWANNHWHIDKPIDSALCIDDPAVEPAPPVAPFDTFIGVATGALNGVDGSVVHFTFVDAGEPGRDDQVKIMIWAPGDDPSMDTPVLDVSGNLTHGNLQVHYDQPHGQQP